MRFLSHTCRCSETKESESKRYQRAVERFSVWWDPHIHPQMKNGMNSRGRADGLHPAFKPDQSLREPFAFFASQKVARSVVSRVPRPAHRLLRTCRLDAERPSGGRWNVGLGEMYPTPRRELGFVPDHASRDAFDIRNVGAAKPERIIAAGLLLFGSIGAACRRPHPRRERDCQHQAELEIPGPDIKHESPDASPFSNCE